MPGHGIRTSPWTLGADMIRFAAAALVIPATLALSACGPPADGNEASTGDAMSSGGQESASSSPEARLSAGRHTPTDAERAAILDVVQSLFDALGERDTGLLREVLDPGILMRSVERSAEGERSASTSTLEGMVARLEAEGPRMTERMFDPEVRVSGDLAMVWTPYDFYVGDELSHCGADAFILVREGGGAWKVTSLSWTRLQPPECELHPDGPPS